MLAESSALLKQLGVPISDSVCPEVKLTSSHRYFGRCVQTRYLKNGAKLPYAFRIDMPGFVLGNTEKNLRNTLIHELIHTVPGGQCHTGEWKKWAKFVSERTEFQIQRCGGDVTPQDLKNLMGR